MNFLFQSKFFEWDLTRNSEVDLNEKIEVTVSESSTLAVILLFTSLKLTLQLSRLFYEIENQNPNFTKFLKRTVRFHLKSTLH